MLIMSVKCKHNNNNNNDNSKLIYSESAKENVLYDNLNNNTVYCLQ